MSEKALIIGGSRFVGPYLIDLLQKDNQQVTVFNRGNHPLNISGIDVILGDRRQDLHKLVDHYDITYDMIAFSGQDTQNLIDEVKTDFIVHMSTVSVYSKPTTYPINESSPLGEWFAGDYGKSKIECEEILVRSGKPYTVLRPTYILGPNNYSPRESFIYEHSLQNKPLSIPGNGQALNQFVFADEVAKSMFTLGKQRAVGAYNCAGDQAISLTSLAQQMAYIATGTELKRINYDYAHDQENWDRSIFPFANVNMVFDNSKIKSLGVSFSPLIQRLEQNWETHYRHEFRGDS